MGLWVVCEATLQASATLFRTVSPRTSVNKGIKKDRASRGPGLLGDCWKSLSCSDVRPTSLANSGYVGELQVR
jgi:hypothetical protein